ncbi:hypothetical protein [Salinispora arenicola]|uniref:hypothetical protein n=1 Tax=Salinispora arenicola TaxID=168697 RepID=UPI0016A9971C|nr:hypothetical protein [Salinispora arenicola]NIL64783.1 hypothetical protein [Salinispora arenicola]
MIGKYASVALLSGTLLNANALVDKPFPAPGEQVVGVTLKAGQMPSAPLRPGASVLLVSTEESTQDKPAAAAPTIRATVVHVIAAALRRHRHGIGRGRGKRRTGRRPAGRTGPLGADPDLGELTMAVICLASAKGSPGVTTAGLAFALTWSRPWCSPSATRRAAISRRVTCDIWSWMAGTV